MCLYRKQKFVIVLRVPDSKIKGQFAFHWMLNDMGSMTAIGVINYGIYHDLQLICMRLSTATIS